MGKNKKPKVVKETEEKTKEDTSILIAAQIEELNINESINISLAEKISKHDARKRARK